MQRLLRAKWDAEATEHDWGVEVDGHRSLGISWADDNLVTASSFVRLRCMLRHVGQILGGCGMTADSGDLDKCVWVSANDSDSDHTAVGRGAIQRVT